MCGDGVEGKGDSDLLFDRRCGSAEMGPEAARSTDLLSIGCLIIRDWDWTGLVIVLISFVLAEARGQCYGIQRHGDTITRMRTINPAVICSLSNQRDQAKNSAGDCNPAARAMRRECKERHGDVGSRY